MAEKRIDIKLSAQGAEQVEGVFARIGQRIKQSNRDFKEGGGEDVAKFALLRGGIVGVAALAVDRLAAAAKVFRTEINLVRSGMSTWGQAVEEIASTIPIAGSVIEIGNAVLGLEDPKEFRARIARESASLFNQGADSNAARNANLTRDTFGTQRQLRQAGVEYLQTVDAVGKRRVELQMQIKQAVEESEKDVLRQELDGLKQVDQAAADDYKSRKAEILHQRELAFSASDDRIASEQGQAQESRLHLQRQGLEAELAQIKRVTEEKINARFVESREALRGAASQEERQRIVDQFNAEKSAINAQGGTDSSKAIIDSEEKRFDLSRALAAAAKDQLTEEAKWGDTAASSALRAIDINDKYLARKKELIAVIRDENATESQRAAARELLGGVESQRLRELQGQDFRFRPSGQLAGAEDQRFLSGRAQQAREQQQSLQPLKDVASNTKQAATLLETLTKQADKFIQFITANPAGSF